MPPCLKLYHLDYLFAAKAVHARMNNNDPDGTDPGMSRFPFRRDEPQICGLISVNACQIIFLVAGCLIAVDAKREICPFSTWSTCSNNTRMWRTESKQLQHRLSYLFSRETCSLGPEVLLQTELKSTLLLRKLNQSFLSLQIANKSRS